MSGESLKEQLATVRGKLFPSDPVTARSLRKTARRLGELVPNALDQELRRYIHANRKFSTQEQERRLKIIIRELGLLREDFFLNDVSPKLRSDLIELAKAPYTDAVRRAQESTRVEQAEERTRRVRKDQRNAIDSCLADMSALAADVDVPLRALSDHDLELCLAWTTRPRANDAPISEAWRSYRRSDPNDALRMWSARSAEIAAANFFSQWTDSVQDVAIGQLEGTTSDWETHDLEVDGQAFDVKNARRSFTSPNTYVEHTVPRFKQTYRASSDVRILGVLSEYVPWTRIDEGSYGTALILGELRHSDLIRLVDWADSRFEGKVDLAVFSKGQLANYPGWLFEYPDESYSKREGATQQLRHLLSDETDLELPGWISAQIGARGHSVASECSEIDRELAHQFISLREALGITRRSLFAWVLGVMLETWIRSDGRELVKTAAALRTCLFRRTIRANGSVVKQQPAGLYDPLEYVHSLIAMFESLASVVSQRELAPYRFFKLSAPTILRGQHQNGTWQTIFAHCGGWRRDPVTVPCGKNPIHLGNSEVCPECGYLICADCGHCKIFCTECAQRQAITAGA